MTRLLRWLGFKGYRCDVCDKWRWRIWGKADARMVNGALFLGCPACVKEARKVVE